VISPSAALKELIENSIDAGATAINILVQGGGLQLLQIQDDGCGINARDFPILCERFTTSKIREFTDLRKVQSFGFRGEALASISYCSYLQVTTMTPDEDVGHTAHFQDGKLTSDVQTVASKPGTTISVKDLFFNSKQRKRSIGAQEEYQRICEVVSRYAIHYPLCRFTCKRVEDKKTDVTTYSIERPDKLMNPPDSDSNEEDEDPNEMMQQLN
jgi:DNA mismatch repair protein MLH1